MKNTDIEDGNSMELLSPDHLESQKTVLSQDVFRNSFTWLWCEIYKSLIFRIWLLLWLLLGIWSKFSTNRIYLFVALLFQFLGLASLPLIHFLSRKRALSKQLTEFSKEITKNAPGTNTDDWKSAAASFNSYLYESKAWNTRYFFFNGLDCQEEFRKTLLEPFFLKKDEAARVKSFKDSVPYIEEALGVYFTEVEKQWKLLNEKSWSPAGLEDAKLPKDTHRSKLAWFLKRIFTIYSLPSWFAFLNCICVSQHFWLPFRILCPGLFFLMMVKDFQNGRFFLPLKMEHKMQFLSTIINEQESGANGWDEIARKMNWYLFEKKVWNNEEFFFDGIDCEWFFSCFFYRLLSAKKSMWALSLNVELWPYIKEAQLSCSEESLA
ncbi:AMM_1a_G0022490.mRNA.1.CDS.1 [Saccharomyces cerevisiae]|nr:AMM_1a_G0022490.mRNA.1.CDS.1 [Saccharomyces cerevisiae]CAI6694492.1 AMM_1a_G0022490.mRNA.1.CDS.1 [Saccharomyces cerevisiae]